jgi:hypothetical protein
MSDPQVNLRYMVADPLASADWYARHFGFTPVGPQVAAFAAVEKGPLPQAALDRLSALRQAFSGEAR